jgi:uncharacterized protein (DUF1499 family)
VSTRMTLEGDEYVGLKGCGVAPNCFSSSLSVEDDVDHAIPAWTYPSSYNIDVKRALDDMQAVIQAYPPGQNGVDGGGFAIQTINDRYLYVQFEALKNGYIDDFEAAAIGQDAKSLQVRSSSRVGYLDYGVNAKRLNYIASELRKRGWDAEGVDFKKHRGYAMENGLN